MLSHLRTLAQQGLGFSHLRTWLSRPFGHLGCLAENGAATPQVAHLEEARKRVLDLWSQPAGMYCAVLAVHWDLPCMASRAVCAEPPWASINGMDPHDSSAGRNRRIVQ